MKKFKKGQWLIRKWTKKHRNEIDLIKFESYLRYDKNHFSYLCFYRFKNNKLIYIGRGSHVFLKDSRLLFQLRSAKKSEIRKYSDIVFNTHCKLLTIRY